MKKIIYLLIGIYLLTLVSADLCTERTTSPCDIITPNITCSGDYTLYDLSDYSSTSESMSNIGQGLYNFTIAPSEGSYSLLLCSGHTTDIEIISTPETYATQENISLIMTNSSSERNTILSDTNAILLDTGTTLPDHITQNTSSIMSLVSTNTTNIMNYMINTIYDFLINTLNLNVNATAQRVWDYNSTYIDPTGNYLTTQNALKRIAEYTEEGGY